VVGLSGDPDGDGDSRPHLHFEVRSIDQSVAYNPILYIDAPWNSLLGIDSRLRPAFQRDLSNPRRWMSLIDQPDVYFGGRRLNDYAYTWPPPFNRGAPATTLPNLTRPSIEREWSTRQIMNFGCCAGAWWNQDTIYFMDGGEGQIADMYALPRDAAEPTIAATDTAPPLLSADGTYQVIYQQTQSIIQRLDDGAQWAFSIPGSFPVLSPSNERIFWAQGDDDTGREIWVAALDGSLNQRIWASQGRNASARWLDDDHLLISEREPVPGRYTTLTVVNVNDTLAYPLGTWWGVRNIQIAPGGQRLIFFSTFNPDITNDGAFALDIQPGAVPQRLPWFADYRWRDSSSLFYITYDPATDIQQLNFYDVLSGEFIPLTDPALTPFTIANGDWSVSPDGTAIVFQDARDGNLWLLEQP
jgi:hypothetical protein